MSSPNGTAGASLSLGGLGTFLSAAGTFTNESAKKRAAKENATYSEYQAGDAKRRGELALQKVQRENSQKQGSLRANLAARGLDLSTGSPLALIDQGNYFGALDENATKENTEREVYGFRMQGANYRAEADSINPWLTVGATGLAGAGAVADRWYSYKKAGTTPFKK